MDLGEVEVIRILLNEVDERDRGDLPGLIVPMALDPDAPDGAVWVVMGSGRVGGVFGDLLCRGKVIVSGSLKPVKVVVPLLTLFDPVDAAGKLPVSPAPDALTLAPNAFTGALTVDGPAVGEVANLSRNAARSV